MKIVHTSDWHFEEAKHRKPAADGVDQGWHDVASALDQIVAKAIEIAGTLEPVVFAFGGDLARTRKPSPQTYAHVASAIAKLHRNGIPVIGIPGNHDIASNGEANALDPLAHLPGFHLFNQPEIAYVEHRSTSVVAVNKSPRGATKAAIVCVPWLLQSVAAANLPDGLSLAERLNAMSHAALAIIRDLAADPISQGIPTFLLYHGTVQGGLTPTGQMAHLFHEPVLGTVELDQIGLAGVMVGHLHKRQQLAAGTPMWYSSSVERLNFGDENDTKGALVWSVPEAGEKATVEPFDIDARRFMTLTNASVYDTVEDAIVRVRLNEPLGDRDIARELLDQGAHAVTEVVIDQPERGVAHASMDVARYSPLDALREWLLTEYPDDDGFRDAVLSRAASLDEPTTITIPEPEAIPA